MTCILELDQYRMFVADTILIFESLKTQDKDIFVGIIFTRNTKK